MLCQLGHYLSGSRLERSIDSSELLQKPLIAVIEADDLAKLGAITLFVLDHLAPNLDRSEQQNPMDVITIFIDRPNRVPERIDAMGLHVTRSWLMGQPDVISDKNAVEQVIAPPEPTRGYNPPSTIRDDLSRTNTLVPERVGKLLTICTWRREHVRYLAGCVSGLMTGAGLVGALLGGGGRTGSSVGATGSSSGTTV